MKQPARLALSLWATASSRSMQKSALTAALAKVAALLALSKKADKSYLTAKQKSTGFPVLLLFSSIHRHPADFSGCDLSS